MTGDRDDCEIGHKNQCQWIAHHPAHNDPMVGFLSRVKNWPQMRFRSIENWIFVARDLRTWLVAPRFCGNRGIFQWRMFRPTTLTGYRGFQMARSLIFGGHSYGVPLKTELSPALQFTYRNK